MSEYRGYRFVDFWKIRKSISQFLGFRDFRLRHFGITGISKIFLPHPDPGDISIFRSRVYEAKSCLIFFIKLLKETLQNKFLKDLLWLRCVAR